MAEQAMPSLIDARHPEYSAQGISWRKWRLTYQGGDSFLNEYLKPFSGREDISDFNKRKEVTPSPSFAKAAINDVKNGVFQRMSDIIRKGGSKSYQRAVLGLDNGVDMHGSSMNSFLGRFVLPELLTMAKVGVYVDMPELEGNTLLDSAGKKPYIYLYRAEEILSWTYRSDKADEFASVLLRDWQDLYTADGNLPQGQWMRYRYVWLAEDGKVHVRFYNEDASVVDKDGNPIEPTSGEFILDIDFIPFVVLNLSDSLLADVANHQIALLNLESSDIAYALNSNFPFYVEQADDRAGSEYLANQSGDAGTGTQGEANTRDNKKIEVGTLHGRRYTTQNAPAFINPSAEPLTASMAKQTQLKNDIRQLINLALTNLTPRTASADSKQMDDRGLEAGLSYIGLELEHAERKIAIYWSAYERSNEETLIKYPEKYSIQSDEDRRKDAEQLGTLRDTIPSGTFQKEISKQIVYKLVGNKVPPDVVDTIYAEINKAECYTAKHDVIQSLVEGGIMDKELAATLLGIPKEHVAQANAEQAQRLALISASQTPGGTNSASRGNPDASVAPVQQAADEKALSRDNTQSADTTPKVRGPAAQGK